MCRVFYTPKKIRALGVSLPPDSINRRPIFKLTALAEKAALEQFLGVYDWVMEEIRRT
jgi:hypothetical protein